jgi:hypothetical protein
MLYLDFRHINDFGKHLKSKGVREAYVVHGNPRLEVSEVKFRTLTFSARIEDYVAVCTFPYHHDANLPPMEELNFIKQEVDMLREELTRYDVDVLEGRWTGEIPRSLASE